MSNCTHVPVCPEDVALLASRCESLLLCLGFSIVPSSFTSKISISLSCIQRSPSFLNYTHLFSLSASLSCILYFFLQLRTLLHPIRRHQQLQLVSSHIPSSKRHSQVSICYIHRTNSYPSLFRSSPLSIFPVEPARPHTRLSAPHQLAHQTQEPLVVVPWTAVFEYASPPDILFLGTVLRVNLEPKGGGFVTHSERQETQPSLGSRTPSRRVVEQSKATQDGFCIVTDHTLAFVPWSIEQ